jgi:hypothetical protein
MTTTPKTRKCRRCGRIRAAASVKLAALPTSRGIGRMQLLCFDCRNFSLPFASGLKSSAESDRWNRSMDRLLNAKVL